MTRNDFISIVEYVTNVDASNYTLKPFIKVNPWTYEEALVYYPESEVLEGISVNDNIYDFVNRGICLNIMNHVPETDYIFHQNSYVLDIIYDILHHLDVDFLYLNASIVAQYLDDIIYDYLIQEGYLEVYYE